MGIFARLRRTDATGSALSTPGELPPVPGALAARMKPEFSGGVLSRDEGTLHYGTGGTLTSRPYSIARAVPESSADTLAVPWRPNILSWGTAVARGPLPAEASDPFRPPHPPTDPAGPQSGRGRLSGGALASQEGTLYRGVGERVSLVGMSWDPRHGDPDSLLPPRPAAAPYRPGKLWRAYYIRPRRDWGVEPFFSGTRPMIRAQFARTPAGGQMPHGGPNPAVYRPMPLPWDAGVLRGNPS